MMSAKALMACKANQEEALKGAFQVRRFAVTSPNIWIHRVGRKHWHSNWQATLDLSLQLVIEGGTHTLILLITDNITLIELHS